MRFLRFLRPETRATDYTDADVAAALARARGTVTGRADATAALETAAGLWGRAFAMADVTAPGEGGEALTPDVLATMAHTLCRDGDSLHLLALGGGRFRLRDVEGWDVYGGPDPATWTYRCDLAGPTATAERVLPAAGVVHLRLFPDPRRPWEGRGPMQWASDGAALAGNLELRLREEAGGPVGSVLPTPRLPKRPGDTDETAPLAALQGDLAQARGRLLAVETMAAGMGEGRVNAPGGDWMTKRFGPDPPAPLVSLRSDAAVAVLSAAGVPPTLAQANSDGTAQRESWRRFLFGTILPIAAILLPELRDKLGAPALDLTFEGLAASDVQGRARAWRSLVGKDEKMAPADARRLVGFPAA